MAEPHNDGLEPVLEHAGDTRLSPAHGVAAIALSLAMKYHDISTIQDGTLYQQYKLEGKNMTPLHIDMVFDTAMKIEQHLMASSDRIANMLIEAITHDLDQEEQDQSTETTGKPA